MSTPEVVIDKLVELSTNKVFCDVGCGYGNVLRRVRKTATDVFGIDKDRTAKEIVVVKKFKIILGNALEIEIPPADVYYIWIGVEVLLKVASRIRQQYPNALILIGAELSYLPEMKHWVQHHMDYYSNIFIEFNEPTRRPHHRRHGLFCLSVF